MKRKSFDVTEILFGFRKVSAGTLSQPQKPHRVDEPCKKICVILWAWCVVKVEWEAKKEGLCVISVGGEFVRMRIVGVEEERYARGRWWCVGVSHISRAAECLFYKFWHRYVFCEQVVFFWTQWLITVFLKLI